ncbi:MAG: LLM class flavin-dependent oxidoreductase [Gammaproteobacteria bacterium]|nr:LLM class flavin-dependent oxidoreductase [Gammaproteobacteria bacterium]NND36247.1 LLM class flavin-dependent oxidoreductase [Gammaproteobacteria bacterium]
MKIHFILEPASADDFLAAGKLAESYGFEAVWTANHLSARDPFLSFSALARDSEAIRMGPVAVSPFELHPLKMANQLLTLNELAGGRANIVVGGGGGTTIAMHLKADRYVMHPKMVRGVRECVEFLKGASPTDPLSYDGEVFQVDNYCPKWATDEAPVVYVGATKPQMLRMAARVADGVMFSDLTLGRLDETMTTLRDGLAAADRTNEPFRINNLFSWHVKRDRHEAIAEARRKLWVRGMLEHWYISPALNERDCRFVAENMPAFIKAYVNDSPVIEGVPDELVDLLIDELTFTGDLTDVDKLIERFWTFKQAGVTEMSLRLYDDPTYSITVIGETIGRELR